MPRRRSRKRASRPPRAAPRQPPTSRSVARTALQLLLVAAAAIAVYAQTVGYDFVWDDRKLIVEDPVIKSSRHLDEIFVRDFFYRHEDDVAYGYYRPVVTLSYMADYALWRLDSGGYHLTNVLLHAVASALVLLCLVELALPPPAALLGALLFAVHPVHTENVAWISGRTDVVAFVLAALAFWLWLVARRRKGEGEPGGYRALLAGSLAAYAVALLAKEMSVVLLVWVGLVLWVGERRRFAAAVRGSLPFAAVTAAYLVWRFAVIDVAPPGDPTEEPLWVVLLSAPHTLVRYLGKLVAPVELNAYLQNPHARSLLDPRWLGSIALLAALVLGVVAWGKRDRRAPLLAALVAGSFLPVINLVRIAGPTDMGNVMAERFLYFPSFPFVGLAALGGWTAWCRAGERGARPALAGAALLLVAAGTWGTVTRNRTWRDELTFLERTLAKSPDSVLLLGNQAVALTEDGRYREADAVLERAESLAPADYHVLSSRIFWYVSQGRAAEAVPLQEAVVDLVSRGEPKARNNLAFLYRVTGREEEARRILLDLLDQGRDYSDVHVNLGEIYRRRGELEPAARHLRRAFRESPHDQRIGLLLAGVELEMGRLRAAEKVYRYQLELWPDDPDLLSNLATTRMRAGDLGEASRLFAVLLERHPRYARGRINYAQVLFDLGQGEEAIRQLETAARLAEGTELGELARQRLSVLAAELSRGGAGSAGGR